MPRIGTEPMAGADETSQDTAQLGFAERPEFAAATGSAPDPLDDDFMTDTDAGGDTAFAAEPPAEAYPIIVGPQNEHVSQLPVIPPAPATGRLRRIMGFRLLSLVLLAALGVASWKAYALDSERHALARELRAEAAARREAQLPARNAQTQLGGLERDLAEARQGTQELRLAALRREAAAAALPQPKPAAPACATPHSVLVLRGRGL